MRRAACLLAGVLSLQCCAAWTLVCFKQDNQGLTVTSLYGAGRLLRRLWKASWNTAPRLAPAAGARQLPPPRSPTRAYVPRSFSRAFSPYTCLSDLAPSCL